MHVEPLLCNRARSDKKLHEVGLYLTYKHKVGSSFNFFNRLVGS